MKKSFMLFICAALCDIGEEVVNQIFFGLPAPIMIVISSFISVAVTQALPLYETSSMDPLEDVEPLDVAFTTFCNLHMLF